MYNSALQVHPHRNISLLTIINFVSSKIETLYPLNINSPIPFSQGPYNFYSISCLYESDDYKYLQFSHSVVPSSLQAVDCSSPGLPVHHQLPEFTQTHVHWVGNVIQPSHPPSSPSPPTLSLFQHQGLFKWVSSLHQVAKVLEFQLQHPSFQWTFRTDFL